MIGDPLHRMTTHELIQLGGQDAIKEDCFSPRAYYNENNRYAAAWLRNLIADGLIPDGRVDERSIADVLPEELTSYTQIHLFAGIGGWPRALRRAGWPDDRPILTGSCPCQPFSVAGKGLAHMDPRHLWPHMYRIVSGLRPPVVMGEQVAGSAGYQWLDGVLADLEAQGYTGRAVDIPAGSVNAPHIRNRLYWLAHPDSGRCGQPHAWLGSVSVPDPSHADDRLDHTASTRRHPAGRDPVETLRDGAWSGEPERRSSDGGLGGLGDAQPPQRGPHAEGRSDVHDRADTGRPQAPGGSQLAGQLPEWMGDPGGARPPLPEPEDLPGTRRWEERGASPESGSPPLGLDDALLGRYGSAEGAIRAGRVSAQPSGFRLWRGHGFWDEWTLIGPDPAGKYRRVKPGVRLLAHGIPSRVAKLRALGNAIVPELATEVIRAYMETH